MKRNSCQQVVVSLADVEVELPISHVLRVMYHTEAKRTSHSRTRTTTFNNSSRTTSPSSTMQIIQLVLCDHLLCRHLPNHIRCRLRMVAAVARLAMHTPKSRPSHQPEEKITNFGTKGQTLRSTTRRPSIPNTPNSESTHPEDESFPIRTVQLMCQELARFFLTCSYRTAIRVGDQ